MLLAILSVAPKVRSSGVQAITSKKKCIKQCTGIEKINTIFFLFPYQFVIYFCWYFYILVLYCHRYSSRLYRNIE